MWRFVLIAFQLLATVLFIWGIQSGQSQIISWAPPLLLIILVIVNSIWFTRIVSWVIFAGAFFSFLVLLSAFTLRWRLESGFDPYPFYRNIIMNIAFVYISLAQLKLLGKGASHAKA